jgi:hypothetical protein
MDRRLEDRIRRLCYEAVSAYDTGEFLPVVEELREALREHAKRLREVASESLSAGLPIRERRCR